MEDNMPPAVMLVQVFMYSCRIILGRLVFYAMYALMNTCLMTTRAAGS